MNIHGRAPGVIETQPRAEKLPRPRHKSAPLLHSQLADKWLIFNHAVYCLGTMEPAGYEKFVQSYATNDKLAHILLDGIGTWDSFARWYAAQELVRRRKITLYDSREQAEQAMRRAG